MNEQRPQIRIVLADDHPLTREGLRVCLGVAPHITVVAEASDGREALQRARELQPDVVVMDVNMPGANGLSATVELVRKHPEVRVLVLTMHDQPEYVMAIIRAGARGYLSKDASTAEIVQAIEHIAAGQTHFAVADIARYLRRYSGAPACELPAPVRALTGRERQVVTLIGEGCTNRQIAARLKIGVRTVETYRERLMRKLDIHAARELRDYAAAHRLVTSRDVEDAYPSENHPTPD